MFLALDESKEHPKKLLGGVLMPIDQVPDFEAAFVALRIKHKLFGELSWNDVGLYEGRYRDFIDLFFNHEKMTFHSICYRREEQKYNAAYTLIRTVTWKLQNAGENNIKYVLFDNDGKEGVDGLAEIRKIAPKDPTFKAGLEFCNHGASHVLGLIQIADLLLGGVCTTINGVPLNKEKQNFVNHLIKRNQGVPLDWSSKRLPALYDHKIHYFDPDTDPKKTKK